MSNTKKFIVLEGLGHGNRFYSKNTLGVDHTKSHLGDTWYKVVGYADTDQEAQHIIYNGLPSIEKEIKEPFL